MAWVERIAKGPAVVLTEHADEEWSDYSDPSKDYDVPLPGWTLYSVSWPGGRVQKWPAP